LRAAQRLNPSENVVLEPNFTYVIKSGIKQPHVFSVFLVNIVYSHQVADSGSQDLIQERIMGEFIKQAIGLSRLKLQPSVPPGARCAHTVLANWKAAQIEHRGNAPIAVASILASQRNDPLREHILIGSLDWVVTLGAPRG